MSSDLAKASNIRTTPHRVLVEFQGMQIEVYPNISPNIIYPGEVLVRNLLRRALERHSPTRYKLMRRREGIALRKKQREDRAARKLGTVVATERT